MHKVALCISGTTNNFTSSYKSLKKHIIDVLPESPDIFIITRNDVDNQNMYDLYKPKLMETEILVEEKVAELGRLYYAFKCNELRKEYENSKTLIDQKTFRYDIIISIRADLNFNTLLDLKELEIIKNYKKSILFLRQGPHHKHSNWVKDDFCIGNNDGINIYSDCYKNAVSIGQLSNISAPELILRNWLHSNSSLQIFHTSVDYSLTKE